MHTCNIDSHNGANNCENISVCTSELSPTPVWMIASCSSIDTVSLTLKGTTISVLHVSNDSTKCSPRSAQSSDWSICNRTTSRWLHRSSFRSRSATRNNFKTSRAGGSLDLAGLFTISGYSGKASGRSF